MWKWLVGLVVCAGFVGFGGFGRPAVAKPAPPSASPRTVSGKPLDDVTLKGAIRVRLVYDSLTDPNPPSGVAVTLVGYSAKDVVGVAIAKTDKAGVAQFDRLDPTTSYLAFATLPRNGNVDRLMSEPMLVDGNRGARVVLSSEARTSKAAPIDDTTKTDSASPAVAKGQASVAFQSPFDVAATIELVDAGTGKVVGTAQRAVGQPRVTIAVPAGRTVYARTAIATAISKGVVATYRSQPAITIAERGIALGIHVWPRPIVRLEIQAALEDRIVAARARISVDNYSWSPYWPDAPFELPLPVGAKAPLLSDDSEQVADIITSGGKSSIRITRPVLPGGQSYVVGFSLAETKPGVVAWDWPLPHGAFDSTLTIAEDPRLTVETPPGGERRQQASGATSYLVVSKISIPPNQRMAFTMKLAPIPAKHAAAHRACAPLKPTTTTTALIGKPMPALAGTLLDGSAYKLAKGKPLVVNFGASWDNGTKQERPTWAALAKATSVAIVVVASEPAPIAGLDGKTYRVVVDPPPASGTVGPITSSWGIEKLPETFLIDRRGIVRFHFTWIRDWSSREAIACVKAVAAE